MTTAISDIDEFFTSNAYKGHAKREDVQGKIAMAKIARLDAIIKAVGEGTKSQAGGFRALIRSRRRR